MIDSSGYAAVKAEVKNAIASQRNAIDELRSDVRPLKKQVRRIKPRSTTSISIVGTDGGSKDIAFDPFMLQVVRVVDSSEKDHCMEIVSTSTDLLQLRKRHLTDEGEPLTPLGRMMKFLGKTEFHELTPMIPIPPAIPKSSWVSVYRELQEWSVLLDLVCNHSFASDTLVMRDGWLRTKIFSPGLFVSLKEKVEDAIANAQRQHRKRIYLAAVLRQSKVIQKYQLALALEGVLRTNYPSYVPFPTDLQKRVFEHPEIIGEMKDGSAIQDARNMVAGSMFLVKFGSRPNDRVWVVDVLRSQVDDASTIFGYMLADAEAGFPITFYPMSLQRAQEHAVIEGFDFDILRETVGSGVRNLLGNQSGLVDEYEIMEEEFGGWE